MKRFGILFGILLLLGSLLTLAYLFFINKAVVEKGALQITSNVRANVEIDGEKVGQTPLCKCNQNDLLRTGTYEIKIIPEDVNLETYTVRAKVEPNVLTAVDRTFLPGSLSSSYIITLEEAKDENTAELFVASIPDGALVTIDSNPSGVTPFSDDSISPSEHEIEIQKQGFAKKTIRIRTVNGYKLVVNIVLGTEATETVDLPQSEEGATELIQESEETVTILETPTDFLRVREGPGTSFDEIERINPGETYPLVSEENGWYEIQLSEDQNGWISAEYAEVNSSQ